MRRVPAETRWSLGLRTKLYQIPVKHTGRSVDFFRKVPALKLSTQNSLSVLLPRVPGICSHYESLGDARGLRSGNILILGARQNLPKIVTDTVFELVVLRPLPTLIFWQRSEILFKL